MIATRIGKSSTTSQSASSNLALSIPQGYFEFNVNWIGMSAKRAFKFVLLMSFVSLFADMVYEGARSVAGPLLGHLGATGAIVGVTAGLGELLGYGARWFSGRLADKTKRYWLPTFIGYAINLLCVPALALAGSWPLAAGLLIGERLGRGIRKPTSSALLAHAGTQLGHGWVFGFREAMDQLGATIGAIAIGIVLLTRHDYILALGMLALPAIAALVVLVVARIQFPAPQDLAAHRDIQAKGIGTSFTRLAIGGAFIAFGYADFSLLSFRLSQEHIIAPGFIPIAYAVAMLCAGAIAPIAGKLYDRFGISVAIFAFAVASMSAPLIFLGGVHLAIVGLALWGIGMGTQEALLVAIVASGAPANLRASAIGLFDAIFGIAWFAGSVTMGLLYDRSLFIVAGISVLMQLIALPILATSRRLNISAP